MRRGEVNGEKAVVHISDYYVLSNIMYIVKVDPKLSAWYFLTVNNTLDR